MCGGVPQGHDNLPSPFKVRRQPQSWGAPLGRIGHAQRRLQGRAGVGSIWQYPAAAPPRPAPLDGGDPARGARDRGCAPQRARPGGRAASLQPARHPGRLAPGAGEADAALVAARKAFALLRAHALATEMAQVCGALAEAAVVGAPDAAEALAEAAALMEQHEAYQARPQILRADGLLRGRQGRTHKAVAALRESAEAARAPGALPQLGRTLAALRDVGRAAGDTALAAEAERAGFVACIGPEARARLDCGAGRSHPSLTRVGLAPLRFPGAHPHAGASPAEPRSSVIRRSCSSSSARRRASASRACSAASRACSAAIRAASASAARCANSRRSASTCWRSCSCRWLCR